MPHNLEAEISILGCVLIDNRAMRKITAEIEPEDFYSTKNGFIYKTMLALWEAKEEIDIITLREAINGKIDVVCIAGLADGVATALNVMHHVKIVKNKAIARRALTLTYNVQSSIFAEEEDIYDIISEMRHGASHITEDHGDVEVYTIKEALQSTMKSLEEVSKRDGVLTGLPTGFVELDKATSGFQNSDFIIVAGRPSMGKSILADCFLSACGVPAVFFSIEMSKDRYIKRALSSTGSIDHSRTTSANFSDSDYTKLGMAAEKIAKRPIYIVDRSGIDVDKIVDISERLHEEKGVRMVVIDYLQFITCRSQKGKNREQEVSGISLKLKTLAKDLNIPVVALCQLSRKVEERHDNRPMLSDLRESGSLEQDADVVMLVYRPAYYGFTDDNIDDLYKGWPDPPHCIEHLAELDIAKGRDIRLRTIFLKEEFEHQRFTDFGILDDYDGPRANTRSKGEWDED